MSRSKKTSKTQMEVLINFLESNRILISGKCHPMDTKAYEDKWEELVKLLNDVDSGARKDKKQWKTFLYEWKSKTKKKARTNKSSITGTGGGSYICDELNELENRLMRLFGWIHIIGCSTLPNELDPDEPQSNQEEDRTREPRGGIFEVNDDGFLTLPVQVSPPPEKKEEIVEVREIVEDPKTPMKNKHEKQQSKLEKSAQLYSSSTAQMAVATSEMAAAITKLADAIVKISEAMGNFNK